MLDSLLVAFLKSGCFDGIPLGAGYSDVEGKYGLPTMGKHSWEPEKFPDETWEWWKYGDLEFFFQAGTLWTIIIRFGGEVPTFCGVAFKDWSFTPKLLDRAQFISFASQDGIELRRSAKLGFEHEVIYETASGVEVRFCVCDQLLIDLRISDPLGLRRSDPFSC